VNNLPQGDLGKVAAVGLAALALVVLTLFVIDPVLSFYDSTQQQLEEQREIAARYRGWVAQMPKLRAAAKARHDRASPLLRGGSDQEAAALIQSTLKSIIEDGGSKITTAEVLPSEREDNYTRVVVRASFSGNLRFLTSVLQQIESSEPALFVRSVDVHADTTGGEEPPLSIVLSVYGFRA
jgi:hypothetical protein